MDTSIIEQMGIHCLKDFLIGTEVDPGRVSEGDKEISWDGNLYVFENSKSRKVDDLRYRLPIQVKSHKAKNKKELDAEFITFRKLDRRHLKNYYKENGVVLIRPVYIDKRTYSIYVKELLTGDIKKLLDDKRKSPPIKLRKRNTIGEFVKFCDFFDENRYLQPTVLNDIETPEDNVQEDFTIYADLREVNWDDVNKRDTSAAKFYWEREDGIKIPLKKTKLVEDYKIDHKIIMSEIPFYDFYNMTRERDKYVTRIGSNFLVLDPNDNSLIVNYSWNLDSRDFSSKMRDFMFIGLFMLGNDLILKDVTIPFKILTIQERISVIMESFKQIDQLILNNEKDFISKGKQYAENIFEFMRIEKEYVDARLHLLHK